MFRRLAAVLILGIFTSTPSHSQDRPPMDTDRPDQTDGISILTPGELQLETGGAYQVYDSGQASIMGRMLLRYGISKRLELRLLVEQGKGQQRYAEESAEALYPLAASAKLVILKGVRKMPDITLVTYWNMPFICYDSRQSVYWSPTILLSTATKFSDKLELDYNAGIKQEFAGPGWSWQASGSLQYEITGKLTLFGEYFGQYEKAMRAQHYLDAGLLYQINENLVADMASGATLSSGPPNPFFLAGISVRR